MTGVCGVPAEPVVARAGLHMWEEPVISGEHGAGTVFFSGCPLKCVFCQNYEISTGCFGKRITVGRLREIFHELIDAGDIRRRAVRRRLDRRAAEGSYRTGYRVYRDPALSELDQIQ